MMADQLHGYTSSYAATAPPSSSLSPTDTYLSDSVLTRYLGTGSDPLSSDPASKYSASMYLTQSSDGAALRYSVDRGIASAAATSPRLSSWPPPPGVDVSAAVDSLIPGLKRTSEALYHPTLLGAHSAIGLGEDWYSSNALTKRTRFESASNLPIYPQRPGEKDCAHYMLTRTCKFGETCKFDHPVWVPEGGIPDWKEVVPAATSEYFPERPGQPDCPYFLKTQRCKYGLKCRFNHPKEKLALGSVENTFSALPERPSEPPCAFYMKTGNCKFGITCKFHHPRDIEISLAGQGNDDREQTESVVKTEGITGDVHVTKTSLSIVPALFHNSKGLPMRPGEVDCPFYLKTGSCKYGATCRYNHPDRTAINPPAAAIVHPILSPSLANLNLGVFDPAASIYQTIDPRLAQTMLGVGSILYPQRPGQTECDYYMKTGVCKFSERCKFHHPIDRSAPTTKQAQEEMVKLTLAGLPRREGAVHCPYYMKTGTCKYGASCKFDHPPPGEVISVPASQGISTSFGAEVQGAALGTTQAQ